MPRLALPSRAKNRPTELYAVLMSGSRPVAVESCSSGSNAVRAHCRLSPRLRRTLAARGRSKHAESAVLRRLLSGRQRATTLVLVRFTRDGEEAISMPCASCMATLRAARQMGLRKVYAHDGTGYVKVAFDAEGRATRADRHLH